MRRLGLLCLALALTACDSSGPPQPFGPTPSPGPIDEGGGGASVFLLLADGSEFASIMVASLGALDVGDTRDSGFSLNAVGREGPREGRFELTCTAAEDTTGDAGVLRIQFVLGFDETIDLRGGCGAAVGPDAGKVAEWIWTDGIEIIGQGTFERGEIDP